jgi:hypothetical protein
MPFTPYHFGISALPGLGSRGRLDILVLTAANVIIDTEVLADSRFAPGWPVHQLWHFHTLLVGGLADLRHKPPSPDESMAQFPAGL